MIVYLLLYTYLAIYYQPRYSGEIVIAVSYILYSTLPYPTLPYSTLLYSTLLYSTLLYSPLLCSTLYSTSLSRVTFLAAVPCYAEELGSVAEEVGLFEICTRVMYVI